MFKEACVSVYSNKLRSFLTILGVIAGICAVVLMVAIGQTVQLEIDKQLEGLGGNMMIIVPASQKRGGIQKGRGGKPTLTLSDVEEIRKVRGIVKVAPIIMSNFQVSFAGNNWPTSVIGTNTEMFDIKSSEIKDGTIFSKRDVEMGSPYAVIGNTIYEKLFSGKNPIGQDIRIKGIPFKIIGVLKEKGADARGNDQDDVIILPVKSFKSRLTSNKFPNIVQMIVLSFDDPENMKMIEKRLQTLIEIRHKIPINGDLDFEIINLTEMIQKINMIGFILTVLLASIASISLLVGSIGIMNMMLSSVAERIKEIGIRKAIGAPNKSILTQFLLESVLISFAGSFVGMALGIGSSQLGGLFLDKEVPISSITIIISIFAAFFVGMVSGIVPAKKATDLNPIDALRSQ
jgi:putative ABC transport system permease protein